MEPGVVDLNLPGMSEEELAQLIEEARLELAGRQTRTAIVRDLEVAVDRVIGPNIDLMGDAWESGRVSWDGTAVTVTALAEGEYEGLPVPEEPEPEVPDVRDWVAGIAVAPGDRVRFEGVVYRVVQAHTTAAHWRPDSLPALYEREG